MNAWVCRVTHCSKSRACVCVAGAVICLMLRLVLPLSPAFAGRFTASVPAADQVLASNALSSTGAEGLELTLNDPPYNALIDLVHGEVRRPSLLSTRLTRSQAHTPLHPQPACVETGL